MQLNQQIPTKSIAAQSGHDLQVHSIFYTIQGEGPYAGMPSVFLRLAGCNLQCPGCDTEYTHGAQFMGIGDICEAVERAHVAPDGMGEHPLLVITGGEPFRQNLTILTRTFVAMGWRVQIETNGTMPPSDGLPDSVTIVCSPKTGSINKRLAGRIDAYKYVARAADISPDDGLPFIALGHSVAGALARPSYLGVPVYLQPMDEQDDKLNAANTKAVVESCLRHGHRLCLQMHKIVGVE